MSKLLFNGSEWSFGEIEKTLEVVEEIGRTELGLSLRKNQVEMITSDQMLEAYCSVGMPVYYSHWSTGKAFLQQKHAYEGGQMGLAYEIVINSNPCISYLMEGNSMPMQALVLAHASVGHNSFFNMNYLFKEWTDPDAIIDYMIFAKKYIRQCEERYGFNEVEFTLDAAHAIKSVSYDRYLRPEKMSDELKREKDLLHKNVKELERNEFSDLIPDSKKNWSFNEDDFLADTEPEENLLYFIEKKAPNLKQWQREVLRIVRKINQYFYPQMQTQVMNEGWASTTHHYIVNRLYELGKINEGALLECLSNHANVLYQYSYTRNLNPYALGFAMFKDIRRICENPTAEDYEWFPNLVNTDYKEQWLFAIQNFRDESFILQYLSPKLIRDWRLFVVSDDEEDPFYHIKNIHNEEGYLDIRTRLAESYKLENRIPQIYVSGANLREDRTLHLEHISPNGSKLTSDAEQVVKEVAYLWGYEVKLHTTNHVISAHHSENFK